MSKKIAFPSIFIIVLSLALAACSGSNANLVTISTLDTSNSGAVQGTPNPSAPGAGALTAGDKLAVGTLKLEGTDLAVTADEAKQLLPLWQQVKTLSADSSTTTDQIQAVYDQISSAMTPDQVQTIEAMTINQADLHALMTSLGIQITPGAGLNPGTQGTPNALQGTPPSGGRGPQGTPGAQGTFTPRGTPGAGVPAGMNGGMNNVFIDALINLLQQRGG